MCRYRTRDDDASLFLPPPPCIRLSFARLPHGQRGHVPVAMETGPNRDGNSPPPYSLSPLFSTVARRCSSRCLSSSRIRLVFFLPSSLSLSLSSLALPSFFNPTGMPARAVLLVSLLTLPASSRPVSLV